MIKIESKKNKFTYNVYHVTKAFYPKEDIVQTVDEKQEPLVKIHLPEGTCFSLAPGAANPSCRTMLNLSNTWLCPVLRSVTYC